MQIEFPRYHSRYILFHLQNVTQNFLDISNYPLIITICPQKEIHQGTYKITIPLVGNMNGLSIITKGHDQMDHLAQSIGGWRLLAMCLSKWHIWQAALDQTKWLKVRI